MRILNHRRHQAVAAAVIAVAVGAASSAVPRSAPALRIDVPVSTCAAPAGRKVQLLPVGAAGCDGGPVIVLVGRPGPGASPRWRLFVVEV